MVGKKAATTTLAFIINKSINKSIINNIAMNIQEMNMCDGL